VHVHVHEHVHDHNANNENILAEVDSEGNNDEVHVDEDRIDEEYVLHEPYEQHVKRLRVDEEVVGSKVLAGNNRAGHEHAHEGSSNRDSCCVPDGDEDDERVPVGTSMKEKTTWGLSSLMLLLMLSMMTLTSTLRMTEWWPGL